MSRELKISKTLSLPIEAVTQTFGILAIRGAGKTNTSVVLTEEMVKAGLPVVVVDPVGVWWGLRSNKDGNGPGLPITILGGEHGDVPLESGAGEIVARFVVEERQSCVLDLSQFRRGEQRRFMKDFALTLYDLKRPQAKRFPLHLVLDECDLFAPQRMMARDGVQPQLLAAIEDIVRRGRAFGIGVTLISQRPAVINKDVLTQIECLIAMRMVGIQDFNAIKAWVQIHDLDGSGAELLTSIPSLKIGEAWIWSPGWLKVFKKVQIRERQTFDSSATPKVGEKIIEPKRTAKVDLESLRSKMADAIERKKAEDPRELKKEIHELQRQLRSKSVDPEAVKKAHEAGFLSSELQHREEFVKMQAAIGNSRHLLFVIRDKIESLDVEWLSISSDRREPPPRLSEPKPQPREELQTLQAPVNGRPKLPVGEQKILTVCAQYPDGATREQLSILSGYKRSSRDTYVQRLKEKGFVEAPTGGPIVASPEGVAALGDDFVPLPTGDDLQWYWLQRLPEGERKILEILINHHPHYVRREDLSETGYKRSSRDTYIQRLKARQLVVIPESGSVAANDNLF